jgi:hypothetical protein
LAEVHAAAGWQIPFASQWPLWQSVSAWQKAQTGWGGWQLQDPSVLQAPPTSVQALVAPEQPVIWQVPPPPSVATAQVYPVVQSLVVLQVPQTFEGKQVQVPSELH